MDIKINVNFDLNAVIGFFKKNKMLFLPIGICLSAFLLVVPSVMVGNTIKKQTEQSVRQSKTLSNMLRSDVSYSTQQVQVAEQQFMVHKQDASKVASLAKQTTQRELISYDVFPKPEGTSQQIFEDIWKNNYRDAIEKLMQKLGALDAPSEIEKTNATAHLKSRSTPSRGGIRYGSSGNDDSSSAVLDALCKKRASSIPVYADISIFKWYDFWEEFYFEGKDFAVKDCWDSQVAYWVYEDVVSTIAGLNANSATVATSPVKRLLGVNFDSIVNTYTLSGSSSRKPAARTARKSSITSSNSAIRDIPAYVLESEGTLEKDNWTARTCDKKIDVIQFSFSVILESASVPIFLKELSSEKTHNFSKGYSGKGPLASYKHNQITILQYSQEPIERQAPLHEDYRYGDNAVTALSLICEYVFQKEGYDSIMPDMIKDEIAPAKAQGYNMNM
jgi:hypothetical protein